MTESKQFVPIIPAESNIKEFTFRAIFLGAIMAMIMGAANAYLGLKAGMTIAATYTTAVIGMAVIKGLKGTILEENTARTVGSIGGNIASGAVFVLPAFFITKVWMPFFTLEHYLISALILIVAGYLGIMFASILRRVLVEDKDLPFPESIAASEIHKSGQKGSRGSGLLFAGMGFGALLTVMEKFKFLAEKWQSIVEIGKGSILLKSPSMAPAYFGVGYIIGPKLGAINFSGGVLAWGLLAPAIAFFLNYYNPAPESIVWADAINSAWRLYVRNIAIGGMLVGTFYTLFKMKNSLYEGIKRSFENLKKAATGEHTTIRTDKDINIKTASIFIGIIAVIMVGIFYYFSSGILSAIVAMVVMIVMGFMFSAVSGYLVGIIGVSNNPTSGLTVSVLIIAALIMLPMGLTGSPGVLAVLGVAAFTCTAVSVAGEMMQDLKVGHILGGTPWRMQFGNLFGVTTASIIMFLVLALLHLGDVKQLTSDEILKLEKDNKTSVEYRGEDNIYKGKTFKLDEIKQMHPEQQNEVLGTNAGFGGKNLAAPQASLMATMANGIIGGKVEFIMIIIGMFMGIALILMQVKSPMLIAVGMYLPLETSFAIFIGGLFKGIYEIFVKKRNLLPEIKSNLDNNGILLSSGLIAGEALTGVLFAALAFADIKIIHVFENPNYIFSVLAILLIGAFLIFIPLRKNKE
jgi:putative OPT family oligopeptide transporter